MNREDRAKQFLPYAALKGYDAAVKKMERRTCERRLIGEDEAVELDAELKSLSTGDTVGVVWYCRGEELSYTGTVLGIDTIRGRLLTDRYSIPISDIYSIKK